jgi:hypothetical protein
VSVLIVLALLCTLWAGVTQARVFRFSKGLSVPEQLADRLGWSEPYRTSLLIDGREADVTVFRAARPLAGVQGALEEAYTGQGGSVAFYEGETVTWGRVRHGDRPSQVLLFSPDGPGQTFILHVEKANGPGAGEPDAPSPSVAGVPAYPGSRAVLTLSGAQNALDLQVASVAASPAEVLHFYDEALAAAGWRPALPHAESGMRVYLRGSRTCWVSAKSAGVSEPTVISLLHKRRRGPDTP